MAHQPFMGESDVCTGSGRRPTAAASHRRVAALQMRRERTTHGPHSDADAVFSPPRPSLPSHPSRAHLWSIFMRSVALPSSTRPRRMSSKMARLSAMGLSRHGEGSMALREASISSLVWGRQGGARRRVGSGGAGRGGNASAAKHRWQGGGSLEVEGNRQCRSKLTWCMHSRHPKGPFIKPAPGQRAGWGTLGRTSNRWLPARPPARA